MCVQGVSGLWWSCVTVGKILGGLFNVFRCVVEGMCNSNCEEVV